MTRPAVAFGVVFDVAVGGQLASGLTSANGAIRQQKILPLTGVQS